MTLDFSLTYAGIPLVLDTAKVIRISMRRSDSEIENQLPPRKHQPMADLIDELDRQIPFHYLQDFTLPSAYPGRNLGAIAYQWRVGPMPSPDVRINDWYYPTTAYRWSVFRGLATSSQAKAMLAATAGSTAQPFVMQSNPLSPNNPNNTAASYTLTTNMFMLPPRPLAEHGGQFDGFYLITLVDERYWWQYNPVSLHVNANSTWAALITQIGNALGVTINFDPIPAVYQTPEPDSQFWTNQETASLLLDAIAFNVGCVVCRNLDGTYNLRTAVASQAIVNTNRAAMANVTALSGQTTDLSQVVRIAGGDIFNSGAATRLPIGDLGPSRNSVLPTSVNITFPKYVLGNDPVPHMVNQRIQAPRPSCWFEESFGDVFIQNVPLSSGGGTLGSGLVSGLVGASGYTCTIHTTAKALLSGEAAIASGIPLNQSGLTALATQIAADFYNSQVASALDEVYPGTFAWASEGFHDIIWSYSARTRQAYTRVMRSEWNQMIHELQHSTPPPSGQIFWASGAVSGNVSGAPVCFVPAGVGGPSVAQTWMDSFVSGRFGGGGSIKTTLAGSMGSGDTSGSFTAADFFPTQNRWRGLIDSEIILFEGTSGNTSVGVVYRGIDGTNVASHAQGATVSQLMPDVSYGINLVTFEKGQFVYPKEWTSGGTQGMSIVPQIQNVEVLDGAGTIIKGVNHFSGQVMLYDSTVLNNPFVSGEFCWVTERNSLSLASGRVVIGMFVGYSASGPVAPVYSADGGATSGYTICLGDGANHTMMFVNGRLTTSI